MINKKLKKEALEFSAFITDIAEVMQKHKVEDLLCVFKLNEQIRNTYIPLEKEKELYCNISDGINTWLQLHRGYVSLTNIQNSPHVLNNNCMSKHEVENLSNESLLKEWEQVKAAYQMGLQKHLDYHTGNILFANFVNISSEMDKRKLQNRPSNKQ